MPDIQIMSDLHLGAPPAYNTFDIPVKALYLALLGDVGNMTDDALLAFLGAQLRKYQKVFYLYGNHEWYYKTPGEAPWRMRDFREKVRRQAAEPGSGVGEFILLENAAYEISEDTTLLGCTLYSYIGPEQEPNVGLGGLNDFSLRRKWTIKDHNAAHAKDLKWLNEQVASISAHQPGRKIVIFTHHSPITRDMRAVDPAYTDGNIPPGFATDLNEEVCWTSPNVCMWAFGHTHFNFDFTMDIGGGKQRRIVSNQRGYPFKLAAGFDVEKVVTI
jgi:hypothetical protein